MKKVKSKLDEVIKRKTRVDFQGKLNKWVEELKSKQQESTEIELKFLEVADKSRAINKKAFDNFMYLLWEEFQFYISGCYVKEVTQERLIEEKKEVRSFLLAYNDLESGLSQITLRTEGTPTSTSVTIKNKIVLEQIKEVLAKNYLDTQDFKYLKKVGIRVSEKDFEPKFIKRSLPMVMNYLKRERQDLETNTSKIEFAIACYYAVGLYSYLNPDKPEYWPELLQDRYDQIKGINYRLKKELASEKSKNELDSVEGEH